MEESDLHQLQTFVTCPVQRSLLSRKGSYPYDYMDSFARFAETELPPRQAFHSKLYDEPISEEDYTHAHRVWTEFGCRSIREYHDLYLRTDVLLLADVFEKFRCVSLQTYGLDPLHYYTLPGLSWDAALKMSGVKLDLITDIDMYQMIERAIRGGVAMITHRRAVASPSLSLIYLDANSLYAWAMRQSLPVSDFAWADTDADFMNCNDERDIGYILEVDLDYPSYLHDAHNDYPLAPERMTITRDQLSPFQQQYYPEGMKPCSKLVPNLHPKSRYVVHSRTLKLYIQLGMVVTKVYRVIRFHQEPWLRTYIDTNINMRKQAVRDGDKVGKDLYKLMCNAVFGKTMENVRKRVRIELVTDGDIAEKRFACPTLKGVKRIHEHLISVERFKTKLVLCRPIQVGFAILDLSKLHMYQFHYNIWKPIFPSTRLLFTDTDSLCYAVSESLAQMDVISDKLDFSEYPPSHPLFSQTNMKVVGAFKDELCGKKMEKFIGLRPKLYSYTVKQESGAVVSKNVAKGVMHRVKDRQLNIDDYEHTLLTLEPKSLTWNMIQSRSHQLHTLQTHRVSLSACDDKRFILNDGITTLAHGHFSTQVLLFLFKIFMYKYL